MSKSQVYIVSTTDKLINSLKIHFVRKAYLITLIQLLSITILMIIFIRFLSHWQEHR
jgi:hypothetical protein